MANNNEDIKWLYGKLKANGYDIGSEAEFSSSLENDEDRNWYYDKAVGMGLNVGSKDDFNSLYAPVDSEMRDESSEVGEQTFSLSEQDKIRAKYGVGSIVSDFNKRSKARVEQSRRVLGRNTPEGRNKQKVGEFQAQLAGTPTKVMGLTPDITSAKNQGTPLEKQTAHEAATSEQAKPLLSGQSPVPYGVAEENGERKTQWLLPDGSLTTDFAEADKAEYGARRVRLMNQFVGRMKKNGLDPSKQEDVERQAQLYYEAPMRNVLDKVWAQAEAEDKEADEAYLREMEEYNSSLKSNMRALDPSGVPLPTAEENMRAFNRAVKNKETFNLEAMADKVYRGLPSSYRNQTLRSYKQYFADHADELKGRSVEQAADDALKGEVYNAVYQRAVDSQMPQSKTDFFMRKIADQPFLSTYQAMDMGASAIANSWGMNSAYIDAMSQYGQQHRTLDIAGSILNMAVDPTTYISGGVGSFVGKKALQYGGKALAKGASKEIAGRALGSTLAGRMLAGSAGGAANFGTFETIKNVQGQMSMGGTINPETGDREFSLGDIAKAGLHGVVLGGATGIISPVIGNVADKAVKATASTAGKAAMRGAELLTSTVAEGTIFSIPEWINGDQDAFDVWTDNMAMMAGFKLSHGIKAAPAMIQSLRPIKPTGDRPLTREERIHNNKSFTELLRERLDQSPSDIAMSKEERDELRNRGYGELSDLFAYDPEYKSRKVTETSDSGSEHSDYNENVLSRRVDYEPTLDETGNPEFDGYEAMERLMEDNRVSEATRAKAYYILTGRNLPMSTVTGWNSEKNEDGTITVTSISNQGSVVTSRCFSGEKEAQGEIDRIKRQSELNTIDVGEQYRNAEAEFYNRESSRPEVIREVISDETGVDVDKAIRKEPGKRTEAEQAAVERYARELFPEQEPYEPTAEQAEADRIYEESRLLYRRLEQGDSEAQGDVDAISLRMKEAYELCEEAFGEDAEVRMAQVNEDPWGLLNEQELTSDQKDAVLYYVNAKSALDGVLDASNEAAADKRKAVEDEVSYRTHKERGMIVPATMKLDDKPVYIIKGDVAMFPDGSGVDVNKSSDSIIILDESGDYKFISPDQILRLDEAIDPQLELQDAFSAIDQEQETILRVQSSEIRDQRDSPEDKPVATVEKPAEPGAGTASRMERIEPGAGTASRMERMEPGADASPGSEEYDRGIEGLTQEGKTESSALERIPVDEQTGDPMLTHESVDPETAFDAAVEFFGSPEDALSYIQSEIGNAKTAITAAEKGVGKIKPTGGMRKYRDDLALARAEVDAAQSALGKWQAIEEVQKRRKEAAEREQMSELRRQEEEAAALEKAQKEEEALWKARRARLDKRVKETADLVRDNPEALAILSDTTPQDLYELAALMLQDARLIADDTKKKGFAQEMGSNQRGEMKKFFGLFATKENGGITIQHLAEMMTAEMERLGMQGDDQEAKNAILDLISQSKTRGDFFSYIPDNRIRQAMELYEHERELTEQEEREYEDQLHRERFGYGLEDVEAYDEALMELNADRDLDFDEQDFYANFADEILGSEFRGQSSEGRDQRIENVIANGNEESGRSSETGTVEGGVEKGTGVLPGSESEGTSTVSGGLREVLPAESSIQQEGARKAGDGSGISEGYGFGIDEEKDRVSGAASGRGLTQGNPAEPGAGTASRMEWIEPGAGTASRMERIEPGAESRIAEAESVVNTEPTDAQKEAGNYKKGHVKVEGFDITIEQPKGSVRRGTDASGKKWESTMNHTYGYIRGTKGVDGDHIDVFLSETPEEGNVYVVDQYNPDGSFDEHKVMYGFADTEGARSAYLSNYEKGWENNRRIDVTGVTKDDFKKWIQSSKRKTKPFAEYSSVRPIEEIPKIDEVRQPLSKEDYKEALASVTPDKKTRRERTKKDPMNRVSLEDIMKDLSDKGETRLSDQAQPISPEDKPADASGEAEKPKGQFRVDDEMRDMEDELRSLLGIDDSEGNREDLFRNPEEFTNKERMQITSLGITYALKYFDQGIVSFPEFADKMVRRMGEKIRPWLKAFYGGARDIPGYDHLPFTTAEGVKTFDVMNFDKANKDADPMRIAQGIVAENRAAAAIEAAKNEILWIRDQRDSPEDKPVATMEKPAEPGAGATARKREVKPEQTVGDLFGGLFDEPLKNEKETELQSGTGTSKREGGHESRQNEPLGESQRNETVRADGRGMAGRGGNNIVPDTSGGDRVSGLPTEHALNQQRLPERERKNTRNNRAERGKDYAPKGVDARIRANIKAIELAQDLLESGASATPEQMSILRQFSGWGGLGKAFSDDGYSIQIRKLLGDAYQDAVDSRKSAYYTPAYIIDTMWDIARAMGFKGGNVLEGSAGIGNMLGLMPEDMSDRSNIHAVEVDRTTGGMLSLLYPDAKVEIQGFEVTKIANGSIDLSITNVPFITGWNVADTSGDKDLSRKFRDIHDFCIAKNVRKLKPGGIGIFITSSGTLDNSDKLRVWLTNEGASDVVGAFRMNNQTFGGTGATSDIIVVRKRINGQKSPHSIDVSDVTGTRIAEYDTGEVKKANGKEVPVIKSYPMSYNKYFFEHPENMAGEMMFNFEKGETFQPTSRALFPVKGKDQAAMLKDWAARFSKMDFEASPEDKTAYAPTYDAVGNEVKTGSMIIDSQGRMCANMNGVAVPLMGNAPSGYNKMTAEQKAGVDAERLVKFNTNKIKGRTRQECLEDYNEIKKALSDVLQYQTEHVGNEGLDPLLKNLNRTFDRFVSRYGNLHKNQQLAWLRNDVDYPSILALESFEERPNAYGERTRKYGKTDIFKQRVVEKEIMPKPENVKDGIIASIYMKGRIDIPYIADALGRSEEEVKRDIISSGLGFENPNTTELEVSFEYLSGNVREKLRQAQDNNVDGKYTPNIKALEKVIPMNIPAHLIEFTLGSSWIAPKLYEDFIKERTGVSAKLKNVGGTWFVGSPDSGTNTELNRSQGVYSEMFNSTIYGHQLMEAAITNRSITVSRTYKHSDGTSETVTDKDATQACAAKIDEIRQDFKDWARQRMQQDPEMSAEMERVYNEKFNNYVARAIPDEFIPEHFGGSAHVVNGKPFKLRSHQAKAVVRGTMQSQLLAHEVGTGKTYTLISTAMEMRRLGTARKPMIVVQNATVGQFVESAKALYPNARILTIEEADRTAEGRKNFYAKIKYNDWDMIVVPQSVFERIPDSEERQIKFIQDKIEEKLRVLEEMRDEDPDGRSILVRQAEAELEKSREDLNRLTEELEEKRSNKKEKDEKREAQSRHNAEVRAIEMLDRETDDVENFDEMGIDAILVDEAHEYKHLGFSTAMQRGVKGVDPSYSKKAQGVYLKTLAVKERNNGRNVIFATGTPISNTAAEIWTFMRYLMDPDMMKEYGIYYFDDFVRNFGNLQQMLEFTTSGKFKENNRFAGYVNLPELVRIWSGVADTVLTREAGGVNDKIPKMEGEKAQDIYLPQTRALRSVMLFVKSELDRYENMTGKEKKKNSHIPLVMYGLAKAAAVDARLVVAGAEDDPNSKTNEAVRQTLKSLKETDSYKGTVGIFADNYQNKKSGFNLYEDIRLKLIENGVPADQIVVMKSDMTVKKKLDIFDRVNRGDVRVIMGSTFTLGTGVNIQERLHTLIHVDAPNRPMDYTQRNGRILRQGNLHKEMRLPVRVLRFGVEDSLDVTAYQRLKTKGAIADSIMNGKELISNAMENRSMEEDEDVFGDITAQLSGSEYAMLKNQVEKQVRKFTSKLKQWEAQQTHIHNQLPRLRGQIKAAEQRKEEAQKALDTIGTDRQGTITIGTTTYPNIDAMTELFTEHNKRVKTAQDEVREGSGERTMTMNVNVGGIDFTINTKVNRKIANNGQLSFESEREMTYSCESLGLKDVPVSGSRLKAAVEDIVGNIMNGDLFRERIETADNSIERMSKEVSQLESQKGKPFEHAKEMEEAERRLSEYTEKMKAELAEKEAKYADIDATVKTAEDVYINEADEEEATDSAEEPGHRYAIQRSLFDDEDFKPAVRIKAGNGEIRGERDHRRSRGRELLRDPGKRDERTESGDQGAEMANKAIDVFADQYISIAGSYESLINKAKEEGNASLAQGLEERMLTELERADEDLELQLTDYYHSEGNSDEDSTRMARDMASRVRADIRLRGGIELPMADGKAKGGIFSPEDKPADAGKHQIETAGGERIEFSSLPAEGESRGLPRLKDGEFTLVERTFTETGEFGFTGKERIETLDDVAYIFRSLENYSIENTFAVLVKEGRPLIVHTGMGTAGMSMMDMAAVRGAYDEYGADEIYIVHNHPSGNLKSSVQDAALLRTAQEMFAPGTVKDGIIIDVTSGRYSTFGTTGRATEAMSAEPERSVSHRAKRFNSRNRELKKIFDRTEPRIIRSSGDVAGYVAEKRLGRGRKISYLLLSQRNQVTGNFITDYESYDGNEEAIADDMVRIATRYGAKSVMPFGNAKLDGRAIKKLSRYVDVKSGKYVKLLDALSIENGLGGTYESASDSGVLEADEAYGRGQRSGGRDERSEAVERLRDILHSPIRMISRVEAEAEGYRRKKGWYDRETGEITIVADNHRDAGDIADTAIHEAVGHHGLRQLFGTEEKLNNFLDEAYNISSDKIRAEIDRRAERMIDAETDRLREKMRRDHEERGENPEAEYYFDMAKAHIEAEERREQIRRDATEEYAADLGMKIGEEGFESMDAEELTFWGKIKGLLQKALDRLLAGMKLPKMRKWTDKEWSYVLWRSWRNLREGKSSLRSDHNTGSLVEAEDIVMRDRSNFGVSDSRLFRDNDISLDEAITKMKADAAAANSSDFKAKQDAMKAIGGNLSKLRQAMARQREYDIRTVKSMTDLAKILLDGGMLDDLSKYETKRILSAIKDAVGREDTTKQVDRLMDIMVDNQLRMGANYFGKLLSVKGSRVDARGIEVQGELDPDGQKIAQVVKKANSRKVEDIESMLSDALDRMGSADEVIADEASLEYAGLLISRQYAEEIRESKNEEKDLRMSIKEAESELKLGHMEKSAYLQYKAATEDAIRQNKTERAEAYRSLCEQLGGVLGDSVRRAKAWRDAQKTRAEEIHHNANSDMEGRPTNEHHKEDRLQKLSNNGAVRFLLAPLGTFDQMLRMFGRKNVRGEGYLWNRYMRGWVDCTEKEYTGYQEALKTLDKKVSEVFGKDMKWGDLFAVERRMPKASVRFWDGGEIREHELTQGNLLYIYMADKMTDGRMKLRRMGITEEDMERIKDFLDPRFTELADWMQEEFLPKRRSRYNEVYKRMFGTSMAAIENYFPLKILANARTEEKDVAESPEDKPMPATSTGSIIKRRRNNLALDVTGADAFSVILDHIQQMERWSAFAEYNRDLNTLLSYKRFRNQVMNMTSAYGSGKTLWTNFRNVAAMAAGAYRPPIAPLDKAAVNIAKGVTAAKVSFRMFTALKQLLSMPAYLSDSNPLHLASNIANPVKAWKWSMEHLPLFEKRWQSRMAGDPRLLKSEMDWKMWRSRIVEISGRIGMSPNAFVDAVTVAIGARSMYQTKLAKYERQGYGTKEAEKRARQDATILFNQTQQSSEGAFLSTMQVDRSWLSVLFTVFRNSSMSYTRQLYDAVRNIGRRLTPGYKGLSEEFMTKQMVRDGIDPDKADQNVKQEYRRGLIRDMARVAVFGAVLQLAWNLGAYLPYLIFGKNKDEKDKMLDDVWNHTMFGSIEGLTGGDVMSAAGQMWLNGEGNPEQLTKDMPLASDVVSILKKMDKDYVSAMNDVVNLFVQSGLGFNPQSLTDAVVAVMDYCGEDAETSRECALLIARILNSPQSQIDKLYFDEIDATGEEASTMTPEEIAERYADYKLHRNSPLTSWMYNEEARNKVMEKHRKKARTTMKERVSSTVSNDRTRELLESFDEVSNQEKELNRLKKNDREAYRSGKKDLRATTDMRKHNRVKRYNHEIKRLTEKWQNAKTPEEADSIARAMVNARDRMLEDIEQLSTIAAVQ